MPPDEPNEEEKNEELPEDNDTPFRPLTRQTADDTHPSTDNSVQPEELYDTGLNVQEPNAGNAVKGYDPAHDRRRFKN